MLIVSAAVIAVLVAAAWDWRRGEIPDLVPLCLLATGVLGAATGASTLSWGGLGLGFGVGVALGIAGFRWALLGGGDAKLVAALGAALGPAVLAGVLVYASPCLALLAWRARRRGEPDLPLAPCLAIGLLIALASGGGALLVPHG